MDGNFNKNFGYLVKQTRKDKCLNQLEVAEKVGIHRVSLAKIERGESKIFLETALALIFALEMNVADVIENLKNSTAEKEIEKKIENPQNRETLVNMISRIKQELKNA